VAPCLDGSRPVTRLPSTGTASDAAFAAGD